MSGYVRSDTESVIRHLRRKRRRIVQRRRQARVAIASIALVFALSTALAVADLTETDLTGAAAARALSFVDLIRERSPGERTEGQLTKTKRHVSAAREAVRNVRVPVMLTEVLAPPAAADVPVDLGAPPGELSFLSPKPIGAVFMSPPGGGGGGPPGDSPPGGGGGTPPGSPPIPNLLTSAVPEPDTWLTMLVGFAVIGWSLRRQRAREAMGIAR